MQEIIDQLRGALPPVFLGSAIDELTGGAIRWGTTQNKRCRREIPEECFVRSGPRVLVVRDRFLDWWATTLRPASETNNRYLPHPRAERQQRVPREALRASDSGNVSHPRPPAETGGREHWAASSAGPASPALGRGARSGPKKPAAG